MERVLPPPPRATSSDDVSWKDPSDDVTAAGESRDNVRGTVAAAGEAVVLEDDVTAALPGKPPCCDVTAVEGVSEEFPYDDVTEAEDADWLDDVSDDDDVDELSSSSSRYDFISPSSPTSTSFPSSAAASSSVDDAGDEDDDFVTIPDFPDTFLSVEAGLTATEDINDADDDEDDAEVQNDAELLEHDEEQRFDASSSACCWGGASHRFTSTLRTRSASGGSCWANTVSGDS